MLKLRSRSVDLACLQLRQGRLRPPTSNISHSISSQTTVTTLRIQTRPFTTKFSRIASAAVSSLRPQVKTIASDATSQPASNAAKPPENGLPLTNFDDNKVHIGWDPLTWSRFHHFWLRDHCRCPRCFNPSTKQRLLKTFEIPPSIKPTTVEPTSEGLRVTWASVTQPHVSEYPWHWLKHNSYDPIFPKSKASSPSSKVLWGSKIVNDPPTMSYEFVMSDDEGLWKWLQKIDIFGFCFVTGVPVTPEATEGLCKRIAHIRHTHRGGFWEFTSDLSKGDVAHAHVALGAHTDHTYSTDPAGLQLFHMLSHKEGTGGQTLLVDGFYVASILKTLHPEMYDVLSTIRVPQHAAGEPDILYKPLPSAYPILNLNPTTNELYQVRYNNDDRSAMNSVNPQTLEAWYAALRMWHSLLKSPDSEYWVQLSPGTVVGIDNHRVLHGRSAFKGKRRMCGAYIGFDDYRSKLAVLNEKLNKTRPVPGPTPNGRSVWSHSF